MIKTFLFDMGNVLVYFCHQRMYRQLASVCRRPAEEIERFVTATGMQLDFERGRYTMGEFAARLEGFAGCKLDEPSLRTAGADIFWRNDSIMPVVKAVREAGCRLVLLSNTCVTHYEFVRDNFDVLGGFDDFVLSFEVGAIKPEPAIFEAALKRIGCRPEECFYTDDIPKYVEMGRTFGLKAEVYIDTPTLLEHIERHGGRIGDMVSGSPMHG